jgi:hypothetical protein
MNRSSFLLYQTDGGFTMPEQPKLSIYSRIANPGDYRIENSPDHVKIAMHAQNGELITVYVSNKVSMQFAADVITATLTKNKGDLDAINKDLAILNKELQIAS